MNIAATEKALQQLGGRLDRAFKSTGDPDDVCMALGRRGRDLHRGYVACLRAGEVIASRALLRPAVETNILLRFIREYPVQRAKLWQAETWRLHITLTEDFRLHPMPSEQKLDGLLSEQEEVELRREVAKIRKEAQDAGVPGLTDNGPLIPPFREQVEMLDTPEAWQAYVTAYKALNTEQHVGHLSFLQSYRHELPDGTVVHHDQHEIQPGERQLASAVFASTLVVVSSWLDLGITEDAEAIRLRLVGL